MSLERFISLFSKPTTLITDNGSNFVRSVKEINRMNRESLFVDSKLEAIDMQQVTRKSEIQFHFSPASSPHFNGLVERIVRSTKTALKTVMGPGVPSDEFFHTALYKVAGYLNNFPISGAFKSRVDLDQEPLTPNHFLRGKAMTDLAKTAPLGSSYLKRYHLMIDVLDRVWKRLIRELSPPLRAYPKWSQHRDPIKVGDVGILVEENLRNHFPLVYVAEIDLSADGHGRRLTLQQGAKKFKRSLVNFVYLFSCLLYTSDAADE